MVRIKKHFKALRAYHFKKEIEGGLVGFEAHLGKSGGRWNVHCHILYIGSYISHARLSSVWEKITGDSKVVDIRSIGRDFNCKWRNRKVSAQEHALNYITKYITKGVGVGLGASLNLTVKLSLNGILSTNGLKAQKSILSLIFISPVNSKSLIGIFQLWLICWLKAISKS